MYDIVGQIQDSINKVNYISNFCQDIYMQVIVLIYYILLVLFDIWWNDM